MANSAIGNGTIVGGTQTFITNTDETATLPNSVLASTITTVAATQAEQETGTATDVYVSPGRQQYHDSASKAWVHFNGTGTIAIDESYNVTSLTDDGVGQYRVNFTISFATSQYASAGITVRTTNIAAVGLDSATSNTTGSAYIETTGTAGFIDTARVATIFFGDQ